MFLNLDFCVLEKYNRFSGPIYASEASTSQAKIFGILHVEKRVPF